MGDTVQKIVEAGTARADEKLKPDSSTRSNPEAMADKVLKEGAKAVRSQAAKGQADAHVANVAQAASDARPGDSSEAGQLAGQIKTAVREQTGSQQKVLADAAIHAAQNHLDRKPLDKQQGVAEQSLPGTATEVLKAAESELVAKQVNQHGGVIRGSAPAKIQSAADKAKLDQSGKQFGLVKEIEEKLEAKQ